MTITPTLDLEPADLNIAMEAGDGLALTFTFNVDLTGYTPFGDVVARKTRDVVVALDVQLVQANPGIVTLALLGVDSEPLADRALDWYMVLTSPGGEDRTALAGLFHVKVR